MQSNHKQTKLNIEDETYTDYSFLSRYHYTKSKNYLKRIYRIPMFIGTHCIYDIRKNAFFQEGVIKGGGEWGPVKSIEFRGFSDFNGC